MPQHPESTSVSQSIPEQKAELDSILARLRTLAESSAADEATLKSLIRGASLDPNSEVSKRIERIQAKSEYFASIIAATQELVTRLQKPLTEQTKTETDASAAGAATTASGGVQASVREERRGVLGP